MYIYTHRSCKEAVSVLVQATFRHSALACLSAFTMLVALTCPLLDKIQNPAVHLCRHMCLIVSNETGKTNRECGHISYQSIIVSLDHRTPPKCTGVIIGHQFMQCLQNLQWHQCSTNVERCMRHVWTVC